MTVDNFKPIANPADSKLTQHLSPVELHLCRCLSHAEVVGKHGNHVPVLLTAAFQSTMTTLMSKGEEAGTLRSNQYVFAQPKSDRHLRGCDVMKKFASECSATRPATLRSTLLDAGTTSQPQKIQAIQDWPTPRCVRDVRAFYGLAS